MLIANNLFYLLRYIFVFRPLCRQGHGAKPRVRFGTLTEVDMLEHGYQELKPKMQQISEFFFQISAIYFFKRAFEIHIY